MLEPAAWSSSLFPHYAEVASSIPSSRHNDESSGLASERDSKNNQQHYYSVPLACPTPPSPCSASASQKLPDVKQKHPYLLQGPEVTFTSHDVQYGDGSNVRFMKPLFRQNTMLRQCLDQEVSKALFEMLETEKAVDMEDEVIVGTKSMAPALPVNTSASSQSEQLEFAQALPLCTKTAINAGCHSRPVQHKADVPIGDS
ncbi:hypothetical protein CEUSTIGMA_g2770.t1 [Chlamydomonas eustigma]|uniref:Uncharacterized protein n=1 Tax=Chlamydomonas eustigma TaxID=1157962 RepID=A0A250WX11_9CHLO|nr:hypothetical protein CEUSTIGMA_g2770.t1 [Chlamydomonas eustigma]|eukprot:GAX75325.1 hypothetical protein CEUSTIGMA_g2770.t1 [Chlamydomonas eustigma]